MENLKFKREQELKQKQEIESAVDCVADILSELTGIKFKYGGTMKDMIKNDNDELHNNNNNNNNNNNKKNNQDNFKQIVNETEKAMQNYVHSKAKEKFDKQFNKDESLLGKYVADEKVDDNEKINELKQETLVDKIDKEKNHIGGKCKVIKHQFIKEGTELIIKDVLPSTAQIMCCTDIGDILYLNVEDIELIEDKKEEEWKDIEYHWNFHSHSVYITKNKIQYFGEINNFSLMKLDFSEEDIQSIVKLYNQDIKEFQRLIMMKANYQIKDKKYNELDKEIEEKMNKLEKMGCQCDNILDNIESFLKSLKLQN